MKRALAALFLGLIAACGTDATGPAAAISGSYLLRLYNGEDLPAYIDEAFGACGAMVVAGSLVIGVDGRANLTLSDTAPCAAGSPITATNRLGSVVVQGTVVTVTVDSDVTGGNRLYLGTLAGGVLTLNHQIDYGPRRLTQFYTFARQ
jgi:hypothetical protein